jgi:hypothetical protein
MQAFDLEPQAAIAGRVRRVGALGDDASSFIAQACA